MTDNDRLRSMLDELGIKHHDYDKGGRTQTMWEAPDGERHFCFETAANPAKTSRLTISWFPTPEQAIAATLGEQRGTAEIDELLDKFEHECFMLRVEASETRAKDEDVRKAYERIREASAQAIAATLGSERESELQKALNKAAGNWAKADAELRKALDFMRIWISEDAHLGESAISREFEKAEGLRKLDAIRDAIAATLGDTFAEHLAGVTQRQDERIAALEGLVKSFYAAYHDEWPDRAEEEYAKRMKELGVM